MTTLKMLEAYRGDTNTFTISHSYTAAQISKVRFYVRKDVDGDLLIKLASDTHPSQFTIADSSVTVTLLPADTKPIKAGSYVYDCELTLTSGTVVTVQAGKFWLEGDVAYDAATDTPPTLEYHVSQNVYDALNAASSPSSSNAFVTQSVLDALGIGDLNDVVIGATPANPSYLRWDGTDWSDAGISQVLTDLLVVDGAGSGLDADLFDGLESSSFIQTTGGTINGSLGIGTSPDWYPLTVQAPTSATNVLITGFGWSGTNPHYPPFGLQRDGSNNAVAFTFKCDLGPRFSINVGGTPNTRVWSLEEVYVGTLIFVTTDKRIGFLTNTPAGAVDINGDLVLREMTTPSAPPADSARIIARDDGTGFTELCAQFNTGDILVLGVQGLTVPTYTTANVTTTRSLDVSTVTLADVANVLGTLIQDLQARRILK